MANILVVDDNDTVRDGVALVLHKMGHRAITASTGEHGIAAYKKECEDIDLVITDLKMEPVDGMAVLASVIELEPTALVIIITAHGTIRTAVDAMQAGAFDFIEKPFPGELLRSKVSRALEVREVRRNGARLARENEYLRDELRGSHADDALSRLIGGSAPMQRVVKLIERVAPTDSTVHIHGESGTGKELVANAIHELSGRAKGPFVKVNCGAIPETLIESELFGHEKGAFTGADKRRIGRFELADRGTIFLDEIGEISPAVQVKLLRVLQERTFERVGGEKSVQVDVRVITATNRDLEAMVKAGTFRNDLLYRLKIIPVPLPALRERREDIPILAVHFIRKLAARTRASAKEFSPAAMDALRRYDWPGNVRELENMVEQSLVFASGQAVELDDLPAALGSSTRSESLTLPDDDRPLPDVLEELERQLILRAYAKAGGVKTETARILGIKTPALYYKLEKYGVGDVQSRSSES